MNMEKKSAGGAKSPRELQARRAAQALSPFEEMDRWFENWLSRGWPSLNRLSRPTLSEWATDFETRIPAVDVIDRAENIIVRAEVPGINKENLDVSVTDNMVTIRGATHHEEEKEEGEYYRCERSRGEFSRSVALPADVDGSQAKATFKNGVLELVLPKTTITPRRSIKVE